MYIGLSHQNQFKFMYKTSQKYYNWIKKVFQPTLLYINHQFTFFNLSESTADINFISLQSQKFQKKICSYLYLIIYSRMDHEK